MDLDFWAVGDQFKILEPTPISLDNGSSLNYVVLSSGVVGTVLQVLNHVEYLIVKTVGFQGTAYLDLIQLENVTKMPADSNDRVRVPQV